MCALRVHISKIHDNMTNSNAKTTISFITKDLRIDVTIHQKKHIIALTTIAWSTSANDVKVSSLTTMFLS